MDGFPLVFVDQVGRFSEDKSLNAENKKQALLDAAARGGYFICNDADVIAKGSQVTTGEENSGFRFNKFLIYRIMMVCSVLSLLLRCACLKCITHWQNAITGKEIKAKAAELLDYVRVRNYPAEEWSKYSYVANRIS